MLTENGTNLSGGQKQRIEIARAILKNSKIMLLDEPTSALDSENQSKLFKTLTLLKQDKTIFVIAHKLSNISSGEKMKLRLNELIVGDFNFLILDEPTNNLDIKNKIFLEQVLKNYIGNLIIVSHDKTLVDNICNSKIIIKDKKVYKEEV